jgi:hypothetical protein
MKRIFTALSIIAILALTYCTDKLPIRPPVSGPTGSYTYTSYDSSGVAVVTGWFKMSYSDSTRVTGEWRFEQIAESHPSGPQVGDGELVGFIDHDDVMINLNPEMADNNVFLHGQIVEDSLKGTWTWSTFIGPTTGGRLIAVKKK